jgi:tetratricopeptide (TPR) repeat protein
MLQVLQNHDHPAPAWNIVDALEVLIDAGQFRVARGLASSISELVNGDGRERLFDGYVVLCDLMERGDQSRAIECLERSYIEIHNGGHSLQDKVRIGLLLARALAMCVGVGGLSQRAMLRARSLLGVELERIGAAQNLELEAQVITELAKCYLHAPTEDARAAQALLDVFIRRENFSQVSPSRAFDIKRVLFQAQRRLGDDSIADGADEFLRQEAQSQGGVARALTELAIARGSASVDLDRVESAADIFEANEFLAGAFEARFILAAQALDRGYNVAAERHWQRALAIAEAGGFLHGKLLALLGLFQSSMLGDDNSQAARWLDVAQDELGSELAIASAGLNVAAGRQILGDFSAALTIAKRCEMFFKAQHLVGFQSQAAHIVGTCQAHAGRWSQARQTWARAANLDRQRHAFVLACERQCLVAQAYLMTDVTSSGGVQPSTARKIDSIVKQAEASLAPFGEFSEAVRVRARLCSVRAHLSVLCGDHVRGLRYLSNARDLFASLGQHVDVAMVDALTALSMLEVGKTANPGLAEEAVLYLQRALQFFSAAPEYALRWKLLYYLAVAGVMVAQSKSSEHDKLKWRELAAAWLRDAEKECAQQKATQGSVVMSDGVYADFSPGLKPAAIDELKSALGLRARPRKKRDAEPQLSERPDGYMH